MTNPTQLDLSPLSAPRGIGQHVAFGTALLFYVCAVLSLAGIFIWIGDLGGEHPIIASLGACVVFFIGAGIVLHVIGRANLPHLRFGSVEEGSATPRASKR
jgi:predicted tellurium resistance membrane protein TerC